MKNIYYIKYFYIYIELLPFIKACFHSRLTFYILFFLKKKSLINDFIQVY